MRDKLISTRILRERQAAVDAEVKAQRRLRAEDDPFFKHVSWLMAEWDAAVREAEREYVGTAEAVRLTGWNEATLRRYARAVLAGEAVPSAWAGLVVSDSNGLAFCLPTIPLKGKAAA